MTIYDLGTIVSQLTEIELDLMKLKAEDKDKVHQFRIAQLEGNLSSLTRFCFDLSKEPVSA